MCQNCKKNIVPTFLYVRVYIFVLSNSTLVKDHKKNVIIIVTSYGDKTESIKFLGLRPETSTATHGFSKTNVFTIKRI